MVALPEASASPPAGAQRGVVLVISLLLLWVLTMVAVSAMLLTATDLKISGNTYFRAQALEGSERARQLAVQAVEVYLQIGSNWTPGLLSRVNALGLEVVDNNRNLGVGRSPLDRSAATCVVDLTYTENQGAAHTFQPNDIEAALCVIRRGARVSSGAGAAVAEGYGGLGVGVAGGGGALYLSMISRAAGVGGSRAVTGSDYRHVITR